MAAVLVIIGLGMGMAMAPATDSIMGSLPPEKAGVGSAVNDTTREIGGALGVAILGGITIATYASEIASYSRFAAVQSAAPQVADVVQERVLEPRRRELIQRLSVEPDRFTAPVDELAEMLMSPRYARALLPGPPPDEAFVETLVAAVTGRPGSQAVT